MCCSDRSLVCLRTRRKARPRMRNSSKEWCETSDISLEEINRRANEEWEAGKVPTMVYLSIDLYAELQKSMMSSQRYHTPGAMPTGKSIVSIMTHAGSLHVECIHKFRNFILVGRKEDFDTFINNGVDPIFWNDQERLRVDKAFEDLVILEGNDEEVF